MPWAVRYSGVSEHGEGALMEERSAETYESCDLNVVDAINSRT